jgi:hypothetical protein
MPAAQGKCEQALAACAGRRVCQALSLDESLFCNWFKLLELQRDISDQFTLSESPMRAVVSLQPAFTIPLVPARVWCQVIEKV